MKTLPLLAAALALAALSCPAPADEPRPLQPVNLSPVNTAGDEDEPHVGTGGLVLYYAARSKDRFELMVSSRAGVNLPWRAGEPLEVNFALENDTRSVFVSREGVYPQWLFFSTRGRGGYTLYGAIRQFAGKAFSTPIPVGIEETRGDEMHPWLTPDARTLYFSRRSAEGRWYNRKKVWRVFVTTRADSGGVRGFGVPRMVDLPPNFHHATLTPDGGTMYLQGPLEGGRWGLFVSTRTARGWASPEPLTLLNSPDAPTGDRSPNLSRDGGLLYFASDRPGGKGGLDLWAIPTAQLHRK
jgi:hypothetical protein